MRDQFYREPDFSTCDAIRLYGDDSEDSEFGLPEGYPHDYYGKVPEGRPIVTVSPDPRN